MFALFVEWIVWFVLECGILNAKWLRIVDTPLVIYQCWLTRGPRISRLNFFHLFQQLFWRCIQLGQVFFRIPFPFSRTVLVSSGIIFQWVLLYVYRNRTLQTECLRYFSWISLPFHLSISVFAIFWHLTTSHQSSQHRMNTIHWVSEKRIRIYRLWKCLARLANSLQCWCLQWCHKKETVGSAKVS